MDSAVAPGELARFQLLVDGTPLMPLSCPSDDWEFPTPQGQGMASPQCMPLVTSASITNSGTVPFAYIAQGLWNLGVHYVPGVATGDSCQLVGVLAPGESIDITSVYQGGTVAVLGSAAPFSSADAGKTIKQYVALFLPQPQQPIVLLLQFQLTMSMTKQEVRRRITLSTRPTLNIRDTRGMSIPSTCWTIRPLGIGTPVHRMSCLPQGPKPCDAV